MQIKDNIVLLGMPGAGKSTVGVLLAKRTGKRFLDTDLVIQEKENRLLHQIISEEGLEQFLRIEERINVGINVNNTVIAPGGSVIYGAKAMEHFKEIATVIYLELSYDSVKARLGDLKKRGVALKEGQTLYDLYEERCPLYEKYADVTVACDGLEIGDVLEKIRNVWND